MTFEEELEACQVDIAAVGEQAVNHRGQGRKLASLINMLAVAQFRLINILLKELRKTDNGNT